jgi:hypothetical protein
MLEEYRVRAPSARASMLARRTGESQVVVETVLRSGRVGHWTSGRKRIHTVSGGVPFHRVLK